MKKRSNSLMPIIVGIIGLILISVGLWFYITKYRYVKYTNEDLQFSIKHPVLWEVHPNPSEGGVVFLSPKEGYLDWFQENVTVIVREDPKSPRDIINYSNLAIAQMKAVFADNMEIYLSEASFLSGKPGHKIVFLGKGPEGEVKFLSAWGYDYPKAYIFTYTASPAQFDEYMPIVEKMLDSLNGKFKEDTF